MSHEIVHRGNSCRRIGKVSCPSYNPASLSRIPRNYFIHISRPRIFLRQVTIVLNSSLYPRVIKYSWIILISINERRNFLGDCRSAFTVIIFSPTSYRFAKVHDWTGQRPIVDIPVTSVYMPNYLAVQCIFRNRISRSDEKKLIIHFFVSLFMKISNFSFQPKNKICSLLKIV